jgi:chromosomal replication initiator protein
MSQLVSVSSPASGREMLERAAMLRRAFYPQGKMPRIKVERIPWRIVYAQPIEIEWPRPRTVYPAPIGPQMPTALEMAAEAKAIVALAGKRVRVADIIAATASHFNIKPADLLSHRRTRRIARPRQVAMYLSKELTPRSYPEIGRLMHGRDHTTVLHGHRVVASLIEAGAPISADVEAIRARLLA